MRRVVLAIIVISLLVTTTPRADELEHKIYLPLVSIFELDGTMGIWQFILPEATINHVLNPSAEAAGNYVALGGAVTRVTTYSKFGIRSYRVQTAAADQGLRMTNMAPLANATHYVSFLVRGTLPPNGLYVFCGNAVEATLLYAIDDEWSVYGRQVGAAQAVGQTAIDIRQTGAGAGDFYIDGIQVEEQSSRTTYCDGDQEGCEWLGIAHGSRSQRSALSRAGGVVTDFDDYFFEIDGMFGPGMSPITLNVDSFAILPGGELNSQKTNVRSFTLTGWVRGTSLENLHSHREELIDALKPNATPEDQPVVLRYVGSTVIKEISAFYETGLEGAIRAGFDCLEQNFSIRFLATDPNFYEIGESADILDSNDTATLRYCAGRLRSTGQWDDLGLTNNPTGGGAIRDIAIGPDKKIYFGGNFTGWNNIAGRDYIVRYDPISDAWETVGGAGAVNGTIYALAFGPDGTLYAGGLFTDLGNLNGDFLAQYDIATDTWTNVGIPDQGTAVIISVWKLIFDKNGNLLIGGSFLNWANIANADHFALWDGVNHNAVGAGGTGTVYAIAVDSQNNYYIGGAFVNWAGDPNADYLAWWNGTAWAAVNDTALNNLVWALTFSNDDILYISGSFTDLGGSNGDYIVRFTGSSFENLGTGLDGLGRDIAIAPDGTVYVVGDFSEAGGIILTDRMAKWNGASWAHLDVNLPGAITASYAIAIGDADPVIDRNYDIWLGFDNTGAGDLAGLIIAVNGGTEDAYPRITVSRVGLTSAVLKEVRNETLGLELLFDYALSDGETLTIDLKPTNKSIISSFFGSRPDAILPNSDFGTWRLQSGANDVSCFIDVVGAPTIEAAIVWSDSYWSAD